MHRCAVIMVKCDIFGIEEHEVCFEIKGELYHGGS